MKNNIVNTFLFKILIISVLFLMCKISKGQNYTKTFEPPAFKSQILKLSPTFNQAQFWPELRGGIIGYETSVGARYLSVNMNAKYHIYNPSVVDTAHYIKPNFQIRLWTTHLMRRFYIAPEVSYYITLNNLEYNKELWAVGFFFGYQGRIIERITWEAAFGIQRTTPVENFMQPVFLRFKMNVGWVFF